MQLNVEGMTVTLGNATETGRIYNIKADVSKRDGQISINGGQVMDLQGIQKAYFNNGGGSPLSISFSTTDITSEEQTTIFEQIQDYIASAKLKAESLEDIAE